MTSDLRSLGAACLIISADSELVMNSWITTILGSRLTISTLRGPYLEMNGMF
jgi:hypothetical protein